MAYNLNAFGLGEMTKLGVELRGADGAAACMEHVAQGLVRLLHESIVDGESQAPASALVRLYLTIAFEDLDPELQQFAQAQQGAPLAGHTPCLTLLASAGQEAAWNHRRRSRGHQAIPLPNPAIVESIPMVSQLLKQLGVDVATVIRPDPEVMLELEQKTYNVFYVEEAAGSPHIPAQEDFVRPYGIRSVLGFGGLLPTGNVFAILLFTRTPVGRTTAELFRNAAMNAKLALLPFADGPFLEKAGS